MFSWMPKLEQCVAHVMVAIRLWYKQRGKRTAEIVKACPHIAFQINNLLYASFEPLYEWACQAHVGIVVVRAVLDAI